MKIFLTTIILALCTASWAQNYSNIEATEWDPTQSRWLTGNGNNILAQDNDGNISVFSEGNANYGMEVMNGYLFAIYNSSIKAYDLSNGEEVMSQNVAGAGFLNGMGSDPATDRLWISDFGNNNIIEMDVSDLENPSYQTVVSNTGSTPNGVVYDSINDRVVFVSWGSNAAIKAVNLSDYAVTTIGASGASNCDGIDMDENGNFFVSSWGPNRVTVFNNDFSNSEILVSSGLSSPADISYSDELSTLGVANSGNDTLTLHLFPAVGVAEVEAASDLSAFPNPTSSDAPYLEITGLDAAPEEWAVLDLSGKTLYSSTESEFGGNLRLALPDLAAGNYLLMLSGNKQQSRISFSVY